MPEVIKDETKTRQRNIEVEEQFLEIRFSKAEVGALLAPHCAQFVGDKGERETAIKRMNGGGVIMQVKNLLTETET